MKKYYCPVCNEFKNRFQLKMVDDTRMAWLTCKYCHSKIYTTEDVLIKVIEKSLTNEDLNLKKCTECHGTGYR